MSHESGGHHGGKTRRGGIPLRKSGEAADALDSGRPVLALESTIISHGMPYPENVQTALAIEGLVREAGVVPATVAVMNGEIVVGLTADEIERLGHEGRGVTKVSRRDLPMAIAKKILGATTVSATMIGAHLAGIDVFVTGGIGGVHRDWADSLDISADLREFSRSPVFVVCAGAKAILDLLATMEYLETEGVPVLGYRTSELPAFYSRESGIGLAHSVDDCAEAARAWLACRAIYPHQGMILACPIPPEAEIPAAIMRDYIETALADCTRAGVRGKEVTPYLLARVSELTGGKSLRANISLVENNALVGSVLASEIAKARRAGE